jgi:uncharacterized protein (TIGR02246 family)
MDDIQDDEEAISALLQSVVDGWNRGDGQAMAAAFDDDADYIVFNGMRLKGRQQIAAVHQQLFDTFLKGTQLDDGGRGGSTQGSAVRFLTPEVALVLTQGGLRRPEQPESSPEQESVQTYVVVKRDGKWSIASFQNTRIQRSQPSGEPAPERRT